MGRILAGYDYECATAERLRRFSTAFDLLQLCAMTGSSMRGATGAAAESSLAPVMLHRTVRDTGIGIPPDQLEDIVAEFARANSTSGGHGLATVQRLNESMGSAALAAESKLGERGTFHITPRFESAEAARPPAESGSSADGGMASIPVERSLRILLTDDSADNRMLIKAYFRRMPFVMDEAENGSVALACFIAGSYGLVLMDLQMPVMDGLSAIRAMRQHETKHQLPRTPIIALTASALDEDVGKSFEAGADAHVSKPVIKAALLDAIRKATDAPASPQR